MPKSDNTVCGTDRRCWKNGPYPVIQLIELICIDAEVMRIAQAFAFDLIVGQDQQGFDTIFFKAQCFEAMGQGAVLALNLIAHDLFAAVALHRWLKDHRALALVQPPVSISPTTDISP